MTKEKKKQFVPERGKPYLQLNIDLESVNGIFSQKLNNDFACFRTRAAAQKALKEIKQVLKKHYSGLSPEAFSISLRRLLSNQWQVQPTLEGNKE